MNLYDIVSPMTMAEAKTDYEKRRQRERDVDAGKPVAKQRQGKQTDYQKKRAQDKKDMELGEAIGYESNKAYAEVGPYKRYTVYVTKKKFNEKFGFVAVAVNPRTKDAKFKSAGPTQQQAVANLQSEVDKEIDVATKVSGSATVDFNVDFVRDVLEMSSNTFYAKIISGPKLVIAGKEMEQYPDIMKQEGFKASSIRTVSDSEGATKLPAMPLSASGATTAQLIANGRYALGAETIDKDGNRIFDLEFDSVVADPRERIRMGAPAITIGTKRETKEDSWHGGDNAWSNENHEMVEEHEPSPVTGAITRRIMTQRVDLLKQYGPELVGAAIDNVADYVGDVDEIGSSDVSGWVNQVERMLKENPPEAFSEGSLNEFAPGPERDEDEVPDQILTLANRWWNATDDQPKITNVLRSLGWSISQVESEDDAVQMQHDDGTTYFISADDFDPDVFEGFQDFNKVEPYAVCLAGKPVKKFDYYEEARRFHDNWKQKLYREGNKEKADKITLMPLNLDEGDDLGNLDAEVFGRIDKEKQRRADLKKNDPAAYAKEMEKDSKNYGRGIMGALRRKYDQPLDEAMNKKDLLGKVAKDLNTPFKKAKAGKLKSNGSDFTKGDHWTGPDKDDPSYTRNFGHGYPNTPDNRSHDRYVNKSLKKDVDEADETSWTANSAKFRQEEDMSWPVEVTLEPKDDINQGRGAQVKTMTVTGQSRDAAKKKLVDYFRKNGWAVTGIKFTGDLDEGSFAHDQLKGEINDLFKPVVLQIVKWARAEGMTAKDLAGTSSHFFLDALDPDTYDRTQHLPDNYFNKLMDKANAKAVEILKNKGVAEDVSRLTDAEYNRVAGYVRKKYPGAQLSGLGRNEDGSFNVMIDTGSGRHEFKVRFRDPEEKETKKSVKESYWTKLQNERNTKINSLVNELKESIKNEI